MSATTPTRSMSRSGGRAKELMRHPYAKGMLPFINGGAAGIIATLMIQPVDMVKVRIQLAGQDAASAAIKPTPWNVSSEIYRSNGLRGFYNGISAAILRQAVYTTARMGFFGHGLAVFSERAKAQGRQVNFSERAIASLSAGGLAAVLGTPADLALIRMQSEGTVPVAQRKNYTGVLNALSRISREEGVLALWKGCIPTVARAMALNFGQLAFYSESKARLKSWQVWEGRKGQEAVRSGLSSCVAGFFASGFSLPFDFVKTRLQKQTKGPDGTLPYKGPLHCAYKVAKEEGLMRFYRGFGTYYVRIAPHAMLTVVIADWLLKLTN